MLFNTNEDITLIDRVDKAHEQIYPFKGWVEHNPIEIISNIKELVATIIKKNELNYQLVESISITNQRESVVIWDTKTGKPYTNVMVWGCNRGIKICEEIAEAGLEKIVSEKTGLNIDTYFSSSKLKWFFDKNSFTSKQLSTMAVGTIDTWIIWNLTNGNKFLTEVSNASRTQLFNIQTLEWDRQLTKIFNVPISTLPEVVDSTSDFGEFHGIPIVSVIADSQSALLGHSCTDTGDVKATLGTGSSMLVNVGSEIPTNSGGILTTIGWKTDKEIVYALEGAIRSYSDILNWLKDNINIIENYNVASSLAFTEKDNGGVYFIPALSGLGAPYWRPDLTASFVGLTRDTTDSQLIRAGFEAMAFQTKDVILEFEKESNIKIDSLKVDGGASKNEMFMQLLADVTQKEIIVNKLEEISALGTLVILKKQFNNELTYSKKYKPLNKYEDVYSTWKKYMEVFLNIL